MFYCDDCAKKNEWPESLSKSRGLCEICEQLTLCNNRSISQLPIPRDAERPFIGVNHGTGKVDLTDKGSKMLELRPTEVHLKEDGTTDDKPTLTFILQGTKHIPMCVYGQIGIDMLNEGLADIGYEIIPKK